MLRRAGVAGLRIPLTLQGYHSTRSLLEHRMAGALTDPGDCNLAALSGGRVVHWLGTMFSGESNICQPVAGDETIRKPLNYEVTTFLGEEEFSHPRISQLASGESYKNVSATLLDEGRNPPFPIQAARRSMSNHRQR